MDFGADPVHRERHQPHAALRIETFYRLHQADIALLDQVGLRQAVADVIASDRDHQSQVGEHQMARRLQVAGITQMACVLGFLRLGQQREAVHRLDVGFQTAGCREDGQSHGVHSQLLHENKFSTLCIGVLTRAGVPPELLWSDI